MQKVKQFLADVASALTKALVVVFLVLMLGILSVFTIGTSYALFQSDCTIEQGRVYCEITE